MPAMTMNFPVAEAALSQLESGQRIRFTLEAQRGRFSIRDAQVLGQVEPTHEWASLGGVLVPTQPAPAFTLEDHDGQPFSLSALAGKVVVLDFIFTECPGPCPILTARHVAVQRSLDSRTLSHTHFVSVSLDPGRDDAAALRRYASLHGIDLANWSLLTGEPSRVANVLKAYGIGKARKADGDFAHIVATFLIDLRRADAPRIVKRYIGLDARAAELTQDLTDLSRTRDASHNDSRHPRIAGETTP